jgi:hypothetical protein
MTTTISLHTERKATTVANITRALSRVFTLVTSMASSPSLSAHIRADIDEDDVRAPRQKGLLEQQFIHQASVQAMLDRRF